MGCDIHFFVEIKDNGSWVNYNKNYEYIGRNYSLFSILANVRNYDGFNYIDSPRGLPIDVSSYVKEASDYWGKDGHSHSWFSLDELMKYDWNQIIERSGFVCRDSYNEFKKNGKPSSWCSSIMGTRIKIINNEEMENIKDESFYYYTEIIWKESYSSCVGYFYNFIILELNKLTTFPEDVRIVFWFDN